MNKHVVIRPVGGILTIGVHYIKFKSTKDGQFTGFMIQCPNWNLAEQEDVANGCPVCRDFHWNLEIDDKRYEYLKMPQKYRYVFHAFHVTNIMANREPVFGCIETHTLGLDDIEEAMLIRGNPPDDPQHGYSLNWLCKKAKSAQFKEDIKFSAGDDMPVKKLKGVAWGLALDTKKVRGEEQDLLAIIPPPPTSQELEKKLTDLGLYAVLDKVVKRSAVRSAPNASDEADADSTEWNESEAGGSDDAGEDWEEPEEATTEGGTETADPDDDDWEEEEAAPQDDAAPEGEPDGDEAAEDNDDWDEDGDNDPEPEPPKKAAKKKAGKKAPKKKAAKKAAKKADPEPEEDADDNDWEDDDWD